VIPVPAGGGYVSYTPAATDDGEAASAGPDGVPGVDGAAFAATVAHDLRNPLEVARIRLDAARDTGDAVHFEKVAGALDRIDRLVNDVLALPDGDVEPEPVAVDEVAADAWATVDTEGARLDTAAASGLVIAADPGRLRRLFENLFRNAVEHGSTSSRAEPDDTVEHGSAGNGDGEVTVTVGGERSGATATVRVADDGPGIPEADREQVFQAGYSDDGGTGLGLAIVGQVARAHGWSVSVTESDAGGARFEIGGVEPVTG
jgi:signal transduction histidine kinase